MACPYFIPEEIHPSELWPHRHRLPLGEGFAGRCSLGGGERCDDETLRLHCNLGYGRCAHLVAGESVAGSLGLEFDCVRFGCLRESGRLKLRFVCEHNHRPARHGELDYNLEAGCWEIAPEPSLAPLAGAAVRAWIARQARNIAAG
jgi:hypothetical protein